ncbi:hypothetical protein PG996_015984 [Apiospora saccharicola]|uniref:Zn(2)-C6 fungal-type domain-containing protein n=1 Tax=Apiospora saccharicola TaxID=335842 RepID=A0ABR1TMM5_9PEZI
MENTPSQPGSYGRPLGRRSLRQRGRPILSCRECRRRKIRCDHKSPCAHCVHHQRRCTYQSHGGDLDPPSAAAASAERAHVSPVAEEELGNTPSRASLHANWPRIREPPTPSVANVFGTEEARGIPTPASLDQGSGAPRPTHPLHGPNTASGGNGAQRGLRNLEEFVGSVSGTATNKRPPLPTNEVTQEWQVLMDKSRNQGKSRKVNTAQEFATIITCFCEITGRNSGNASFRQPEAVQLVSQAAGFLRQCKSIAKELKTRRPTRCLHIGGSGGVALPRRETVDTMVNLYFATFESTHRILHVPSFWEDYRRFWDDPEGVASDLRLKVLLVMGIGSSLYDHGSTDASIINTELAHQCIYEAETWLGGPLEKDRIGIAGLQIQCLTILARQIFSIGGDTVWVTMGSVIHAAMQLGLHRDPKHLLPDISCLESELRRRLWATILDLAVQAALDSSMPPRISMDDFDAEPPANINDDELNESTTVIPSHPRDVFTSTSIQITLLEALPIRLRIVQQLNGLHSDLTYQHALDLSAHLTDAVRTAHSATKDLRGVTTFHKNLLDYLICRFMIPLHYSFSNQARTNPLYYYSLKLSTDAAIALTQPKHDDNNNYTDDDESRALFARLMALGGGLFRAGVRGAISALTLDLLTRVQEQRLDGTLACHAPHRAPAKRAVRDLIALSEERVRLGETNVKGHMFLCMILAQVEAVEGEGSDEMPSVEVAVARAARDSLGHCYGLLCLRKRKGGVGDDEVGLGGEEGAEGLALGTGEAADQGLGGYELDLDWDSMLPDFDFT